ncbi:MAG: hypothetical protein HYU64_07755 [Armatimonadetes bacterium]|nr:hypothetical protein [Armatimonadota bacterium]
MGVIVQTFTSRLIQVAATAGILTLLLGLAVFAAVLEAKEGVTPDSVATGELWSGDFLVMRLRRIGNSDPLSEVTQVKERLEGLFEMGLAPWEIKARKLKKGGALIVARGRVILTVTDAQARENDTLPGKLAFLWASNLRQALSEFSSFRLFPSSKTIPLGERFGFQLKGDFPGPFTITLSDPSIGELSFDEKTRTIVVESKKQGWSSLNVRSGDLNAVANVWVKQYAGVLPRSVLAEVTGNPADSELIKEAVMARLRQSLSVRPMAYVQLPDEIWVPASLPRGTSTALRVPVRIAGKDYLPAEEKVLVTVKNVILPREDTGYLMVSNRPETFLRSGVLLHEPIRDGVPVRLMFHHKNGVPGVDEYFQVKLVNRFAAPSKVFMTGGVGGPSRDEMQVGHLAAGRYLDVLMADKGKIVTIPARSEYLVTLEKLAPDRVISGILQFKVI